MVTRCVRSFILFLPAFVAAVMATVLLGPAIAHAGTIIVQDGNAAPAAGTYTDGWIQTQLASSDLTIDTAGVGSGPDDILVQTGAVVTWTTGSRLTLRAQNDVVISGTIQHDGPTNGAGGLQLIADTDKNDSGTVMVGTGDQTAGVAAGSRHGLTRVEGANLVMNAGTSPVITETYALLGFQTVSETLPYTVTGAISVTVQHSITVTGGMTETSFVQVGHGGEAITTVPLTDTNFVGPINIWAGDSILFQGGEGTFAYVQLGNGVFSGTGRAAGSHTVYAGGSVRFVGGTGDFASAQYGNGGYAFLNWPFGGDHTMTAGGEILFMGSSGVFASAQYGNGGFTAIVSFGSGGHSGNHTINGGDRVWFVAGPGDYASAQYGNGGFTAIVATATSGHRGNHTINAKGDVTFLSSTGQLSSVQFGNGGFTAMVTGGPVGHSGNHTIHTASDVSFLGNDGDFASAQYGNGGYTAMGAHRGNHVLDADGTVEFRAGTGQSASAQYGNGAFGGTGNQRGDHTLKAGGDVAFVAGTGDQSSVQFGNGHGYTYGEHSGDLTLTSRANLTVTAGITPTTAYALLGNGGGPLGSAGTRLGDISVRVGATAVFSDAIVGHWTVEGLPSITQGRTVIGVSQLDPYASGTGKLIAKGVTTFTSASDANGGQLRVYLPRADAQEIPTTVSFNGESFAVANTIPAASLRGFYLFGDGPYLPKYSFYLGGQPDAGVLKTVEPGASLALGDAITYTLVFSNSGSNTAVGVMISDTLPAALTGASVSTALEPGVSVTQIGSAPNLVWQVSDLDVDKGGMITVTATVTEDVNLLGTSFGNTVVITATGDITLTNNTATATSNVVAPASIVITKTVVGPSPAGTWDFTGSGGVGDFSLPATGGATTLTPLSPGVSYTIQEVAKANYTPTVSCTDGSSGAATATVTPAAGQTVGCTFTNTYVPPEEIVYLPVVLKQ